MYRINCQMNAMPGVLERMLRIVRVKGFILESMQAEQRGERFDMTLTVNGHGAAKQLVAQLDKLHDVIHVTVHPWDSLVNESFTESVSRVSQNY